jgi:Putative zinc-finger
MESIHIRDCQACEAALCDYIDGTLAQDLREQIEDHLANCQMCHAYLVDVQDALGVLGKAEEVAPPPVLVNRILFQIPAKESGLRGWLGRFFEPMRQPRFVMGAMMTVLSLAMMSRCAGVPNRALTQSDIDPVKIWSAFDDRVHRTWDRGVKAYENIRLVYEIRTRVHDWRQQEELDSATNDATARDAIKAREAPAKAAGNGKTAASNPVNQRNREAAK